MMGTPAAREMEAGSHRHLLLLMCLMPASWACWPPDRVTRARQHLPGLARRHPPGLRLVQVSPALAGKGLGAWQGDTQAHMYSAGDTL